METSLKASFAKFFLAAPKFWVAQNLEGLQSPKSPRHVRLWRVQFVLFEKFYECLFIPNCTRKIMWLLINNIHEKIAR